MTDRPGAVRGVWCPVLTPLDADLQPDRKLFCDHLRRVLAQGCAGAVIFGTTGEATSFAADERLALLDAVLAEGIDPARLLIGTGCCALTDSVRLTRHALDHGVAGVLMLPPFYYKNMSDEGLSASYEEVFQRVGHEDFRLFLYHFPVLSGVPITTVLIEHLAARMGDRLAGIKDSSGDWPHTKMLLERFPDLAVFPGNETYLLQALASGAAGCISASCNVNAAMIQALYAGFLAQAADLTERQKVIADVRALLQRQPMIPAMKALLAETLAVPGWRRVRPPLLPLAAAKADGLAREFAALASDRAA